MITKVSPQEVKSSCNTMYSHMETCRRRLHLNLNELFGYDSNLPQTSTKGTEQVAIVSEIRVEDRTNKETQFEFTFVKGEKGIGIHTIFY